MGGAIIRKKTKKLGAKKLDEELKIYLKEENSDFYEVGSFLHCAEQRKNKALSNHVLKNFEKILNNSQQYEIQTRTPIIQNNFITEPSSSTN